MIDLRSDTLTQPTPGMREAMASADVGDDVFGEDPTIRALESRTAELLGKEAALFVPSGTMSNQIGVRLHCSPGDEILCEADCHIFQYEQAAFAQLWGVSARTIPTPDGLPSPDVLKDHVRPDDVHAARTRLVALENTHNRHGGRIIPQEGVRRVCEWADSARLARHLDGARLWNASVATGLALSELAEPFDTVSVCFSKGLGAPVGSALCGSAEHVRHARRVRKALGGGMRQAGVIAAAALYALENQLERLAEDHTHAQLLADHVRQTPGLSIGAGRCDTNIVMVDVDPAWGGAAELAAALHRSGVLVLAIGRQRVRAVTHLGVTRPEIEQAADALASIMNQPAREDAENVMVY